MGKRYYFLFLLLLVLSISFGQTPSIYFQDNSTITIKSGAFVYVQDGSSTAIQSVGNSGFYIPDSSVGYLYWNSGSNTGNYTIPFISTTGLSVPMNVNITSTSTSGSFKVSNIDIPGDFPSYKDVNSINRYWTVDLAGYSVLPTGSININYLSTDIPSGYGNFALKYYNTNWIQDAPGVSFGSYYANFPINNLLTYKKWTLINTIGALPITLLYLSVLPVNNSYLNLNWSTSTEENNKGFSIERSIDGIQFDSISWVDGSGNSIVQNNYIFNDYNVVPNVTYYYRLNQIDNDGKSTLTYIVSGEISSDNLLVSNPIPNPSSGNTIIIVNSSNEHQAQVNISDILGRTITNSSYELLSGQTILNIDLSNLSKANYNISIKIGEKTFIRKITIIN